MNCEPNNSNKMSRNLPDQTSAQELRILKHYVYGLKKEKEFKYLQKNGFLDAIAKCAARTDSNFNKFSMDIDRVAKEQNDRKASKFYEAVEALKTEWLREIDVIRKCIDCYEFWTKSEQNKDYFTLVCREPHLLVFISDEKDDGPLMWPAKVLSVDNNAKLAFIDCFGDHLRAEYPFDKCLLYSIAQENVCTDAIVKYAKNSKTTRQYSRSFEEVNKYIRNIKKRFTSFVPAVTNVTVSDVKQHLIDMYPGWANNCSGERTNSPVTHGSGSRIMSPYDSDDSNDPVDQNPIRASTIPCSSPTIEVSPVDLKIVHVRGNNGKSNTESEAEIDHEQTLDMEAEHAHSENRKRKTDSVAAPSGAKKTNSGDEVITIEDQDSDANESVSTSSQNRNEPSGSAEVFKTMFAEFLDVAKEIHKCEKQLQQLKEQETIIEAKLNAPGTSDGIDEMLDELSEVTGGTVELEEQLERLKRQEATIRGKIKNSKK